MVFTSVQHSLTVERSKIRVERDGILDANGSTWHFAISGEDFGQLMARWQGGELFPGLQQKVQAPAIQPQSPAVQSPVLSRTYAARHKHLLGSCSGELTLTPTAMAFTSKEHSVSFNIDETQADRDSYNFV